MVAVFREVRRVLRADGTLWLNLGDSYFGTGKGPTHPTGLHAGGNGGSFPVAGVYTHDTLKGKDLVGIPWRVAFALQADGWYLRSDIIWSKPNPMPESVTDRPTKAHEYLFLLSKSARYYYDADAVKEPAIYAGQTIDMSNAKTNGMADGVNDYRTRIARPVTVGPTRNLRSVWTVATQPYPGAHFATFPPKLIEPAIKAGTSERGVCPECGAPSTSTGWRASCRHDARPVPATVLDPFAGSGTTGMVAQSLSRRAVLIDLNGEYLTQAMARNRDIPLGLDVA
jgi:DNA modification methylase